MRDTTFIYGLFDPRDYRLRYIGKADNIQKRISKHITTAKHGQRTHKDDWVRLLLSQGLEPSIEILEEVPIDKWQESEMAWIADCKRFGLDLTNNTIGGGGITGLSEEAIESIRRKATGRRHTEETKRKLSEMFKGRTGTRLGAKLTDESKQRMRTAKLGKKQTDEQIAKRVAGMKGHVTSEETKKKISQSLMGHGFTEETLLKMRSHVPSEEHRRKISKTLKKAYAEGRRGLKSDES